MKLFFPLSLALAAPVFFAGCATSKVVHGVPAADRLFPFGNYKHEVTLVLPGREGAPEKKFEFTGVVQLKEDAIRVVVFSFIGTTAFKINEDLKTGEVQTEIYVGQMKKFEPRLKEYYKVMREVLVAGSKAPPEGGSLKWLKTDERGLPIEMQTTSLDKNAVFKLRDFDEHKIPAEFVIEHPNFRVNVRVVSYEI